jgi:hypothetical protein
VIGPEEDDDECDRAELVWNFADAVGAFVDFNVLSQAYPNCGGEDKEVYSPLC